MRLEQHVAVSSVVAAAIFAAARSWELALSSFLAGVFVDLDHFIDVVAEYKLNFTIREFFDICHGGKCRRIRLLLHSWELVPLLGIVAYVTDWNPWVVGTTVGIGLHTVCDQLYNDPSRFAYFLVWRWRHGFVLREMFGKDKK